MSSGSRSGAQTARQREIHVCNFRLAGHLSKEDAHTLTTIHEGFARVVSSELSLYLETSVEIRLVSLEQLLSRDYIAGISPAGYLLPYKVAPMDGTMVMEIAGGLLSPMIDLLLGGTGVGPKEERELTDLDEELLSGITAIVIAKLEAAWKTESVSLRAQPSIKPALASRIFPTGDSEVLLLMFEVSFVGLTGALNLALSHSFAKFLLRNIQTSQLKRKVPEAGASKQGLRDKVLGCAFVLSAELPALPVPVNELIDLGPDSLLKLRLTVSTPARLMIGKHGIFDVNPVRSGNQRAAQLGAPLSAVPEEPVSGRNAKKR